MERHVVDLITGFSRLGVRLRVICQTLDWPNDLPPQVEFVVKSPMSPWSRLNTWWFENHALRLCQPDWPVIAISRVPGADLAIVGGTHLGHLRDRGRKHLNWFNRKTAERESKMYARVKSIIAHSGKVAREIAELYEVDSNTIHTLYPPVDVTVFSLAARSKRSELRQQLGLSPDEFLLLFPSNNHALKGADLILDALNGWEPRIRLAVAGKSHLQAEGVINLGFRNDMEQLYAAADAVILASRYEAFGLVGPESVLCGTPVLFANGVGAAEVLSDRACIRFERTVPALRAALKEALNRKANGSLPLADPASHIHYPYSVDLHLAALLQHLVTN